MEMGLAKLFAMGKKLHIGGHIPHPDWEILSIQQRDSIVDYIGNANDLSQFEDNTFEALYASHVLEHFDYVNEVAQVLTEWLRVLEPGGQLMVGVPNWDILARMVIAKDQFSFDERFYVMRTILGGHTDKHDYHYSGYTFDILEGFLTANGYVNIRQVDRFGLFPDTTEACIRGVNISLNVIAEKPA